LCHGIQGRRFFATIMWPMFSRLVQGLCRKSRLHTVYCGQIFWTRSANVYAMRRRQVLHSHGCSVLPGLPCWQIFCDHRCYGKFCLHGLPRGEIHRRGGDVVVRLLRDAAGGVHRKFHAECVCAISRPGRHLVHELPLGEVRRPGPWQACDPRRALLQRVSSRGVPDDDERARNRWRWGSALHSVLVVFRFAEHDESGV
jgi:hypothetical protein